MKTLRQDVVIVGGGHNGLVAACYLARAGLSVQVLERNETLGGATQSKRVFQGLDARLSVYSYLLSLFPDQIIDELGLRLRSKSRRTASYTPAFERGRLRELLLRNGEDPHEALLALTGSEADCRGYRRLQEMQQRVAAVTWPSLLEPLVSRETLRGRLDAEGQPAWQALVEEPLGELIEGQIGDDLLRGLLFTDAKIGVSTHPHDPSLLQNRCFLYHIIGRGTGEWRVPVGGMGALVDELQRVATETGRVRFTTGSEVLRLDAASDACTVDYLVEGREQSVEARYVLCNASADVLSSLTGEEPGPPGGEGTAFKVNMLLERLPRLRSTRHASEAAFAGTFHIDEGYEQMNASYRESLAGELPAIPPGEIYCHTLSDDTILGDDLKQRGFHTLTLFGLDLPYRLFEQDNEGTRALVLSRFLAGINRYLDEPIDDCLARDADGEVCMEAMSAVDLERAIHLPQGNIFHGDLSWPFAETDAEVGRWGVETAHPNVLLCGSAAKRGGAVSGIPGHNAARCVLERLGNSC